MKLDNNQTLKKAITAHKEGKFEEAEQLYQESLKIDPKNIDANHNLGVLKVSMNQSAAAIPLFKTATEINPNIVQFWVSYAGALINEKKFEEAELSYKKIINIAPNNFIYFYDFAKILKELGKFEAAEISYKKAIELNCNSFEAYNNLGSLLHKLKKFDEAEINFKKSIEIKPNYALSHNNIGNLQQDRGELKMAEKSYKKAIKLQPDLLAAQNNLILVLKQKKLLLMIKQQKKLNTKNKIDHLNYNKGLTSNPFISERKPEHDLLTHLYKMNSEYLDETSDVRYGNGKCSNFQLLENDSVIIKQVSKDLTKIIKQAVKSEIYINDSFFNIFQTESGTSPHNHISNFDKTCELTKQKFSLTYYIDVGDQDSSNPGILKLYNPDKDILPFKGQIVIIPAEQMHSAVYNGKTDRVMIGINFYCLI